MPTVHDFQKSQKNQKPKAKAKNQKGEATTTNAKTAAATARRRPYLETDGAIKMKAKSTTNTTKESKMETQTEENNTTHTETAEAAASSGKKVEISFPGSEVLRAKLPKPFAVAERVATDWVNDGNFDNLDIGHPLAESLATQGLKKAKEVEKKVLASPALEKVATEALTWGLKAQQEVQKIREQVRARFGKK